VDEFDHRFGVSTTVRGAVDGLRRSGVPANLRAVTDPIVLDGLRPVDADDGDLRTLTAFLNWMRESSS